MRILKRLQAACVLFFLAGAALAQTLPPVVADALKQADIPAFAMGAYVQEVAGGEPLLEWNDRVPLNPASTMKLVTSDAALELLGPTFSWRTRAYTNGTLTGDVLHGDLIIHGSGDPKLVLENFWLFLRRLRAAGIREIQGNLLLDHSAFEEAPYDPAAFDGDPMKPYNVGPDALLLNFEALNFRFTPDTTNGTVRVAVDPPLAGYPLITPTLSTGECGDWQAKLRPAIDGNAARFIGTYAASCGEKSWYVYPYQMTHTRYFELVFRQLWRELGGSLTGEVRDGVLPPDAHSVAEWQSASLSEIIRDINKFSNNVMAKQLLLTLPIHVLQLQGSTERGGAVIKRWLGEKGIDAPELTIENGSGLSRIERISALTMGRLLQTAFQSPAMPEFIASLPIVGYDGTMRRRLTTEPVAGHAHIKTGTLKEVRAIAGYLQAASGRRYAVVCIINHLNAVNGQQAQDALLEWVYQHG
jgi:D-alanyl-D-alanine carboxypeptidase/D-alanyl-D-alanine-endopeptidase (penicillin-binding protein 4)